MCARVYVDVDPASTEQLQARLGDVGRTRVKLVVLQSPYRSLMEPLLEYIEQVENERPDDYVTVVLPEFVPARLVAAPAAQPERAAHQGRAALPAEHGRHERAVPPDE